ncbi:MAG TPA: hypothetical protein VN109_05910, partial [Devosia sp.]|nr:hypothetical protein [Devosia sp.]
MESGSTTEIADGASGVIVDGAAALDEDASGLDDDTSAGEDDGSVLDDGEALSDAAGLADTDEISAVSVDDAADALCVAGPPCRARVIRKSAVTITTAAARTPHPTSFCCLVRRAKVRSTQAKRTAQPTRRTKSVAALIPHSYLNWRRMATLAENGR